MRLIACCKIITITDLINEFQLCSIYSCLSLFLISFLSLYHAISHICFFSGLPFPPPCLFYYSVSQVPACSPNACWDGLQHPPGWAGINNGWMYLHASESTALTDVLISCGEGKSQSFHLPGFMASCKRKHLRQKHVLYEPKSDCSINTDFITAILRLRVHLKLSLEQGEFY